MPILLNLAALVSLVAGLVASQVVQSDIRIEVVATCWIGGFLLTGLAGILSRVQKIEARLEAMEGRSVAMLAPTDARERQQGPEGTN